MSQSDNIASQIRELETQLIDNQESLQNLVFQKSMQQLEDLSQIKKTADLSFEQIGLMMGGAKDLEARNV